jgi:hypothetical protein
VKPLPKEDPKKEKKVEQVPEGQNIPPEVLAQLPPEVRAQLGVVEEQKPIFRPATGENKGLSDSIDRLREGFEKIGLTLIGRMGEFASTLERVVMTVARIEKVENLTAETTYFLKNLQKTFEGYNRDFKKMTDKIEELGLGFEVVRKEIAELKMIRAVNPPVMAESLPHAAPLGVVYNERHEIPVANSIDVPIIPAESAPISRPSAVVTSHPAPAPKSSAPAPPMTAGGTNVNVIFDNLQAQVKVGIASNSMADILDQAREIISQNCKWTPAIYEIGKVARKYRKDSAVLSENECIDLSKKIAEWKTQIIQS